MIKQNKNSLRERIANITKIRDQFVRARFCDSEDFKDGWVKGQVAAAYDAEKVIKELEAIIEMQSDALKEEYSQFGSVNAGIVLEKSDKLMNGGEDE